MVSDLLTIYAKIFVHFYFFKKCNIDRKNFKNMRSSGGIGI